MPTIWADLGCEDEERERPDFRAELFDERSVPVSERAVQASAASFLRLLRRRARLASVLGKVPMLRAIASELFLGEIDIYIETDPEIENTQYVVVDVRARGDIKEIANRRKEWYNLTGKLLGNECELVQLAVTVEE
ncbi:MAG: hypothetical protein WD894_09110 [Pirellulales bacterium]